jgi:hypothetical protein
LRPTDHRVTSKYSCSLVIGLCCHRHPCDAGVSGPKGRHRHRIITSLTPTIEASGPHDFAVRKRALSSVAQLASIASHPNVRDDRDTPLVGDETAIVMQVIWVNVESKYFCKRGWTGQANHRPALWENQRPSRYAKSQHSRDVGLRPRIEQAPFACFGYPAG